MLSLEDYAKELAGNWKGFDSFAWHDQPYNPDNYAIVYTCNRDSGLLEESNASAIEKLLQRFLDWEIIKYEHHNHWACGWVDGYAIPIYIRGRITRAFQAWYEIQERIAEYPILDDDDYYNREYQLCLQGIDEQSWNLDKIDNLPDDWTIQVYGELPDCEVESPENSWPSEESVKGAMQSLGLLEVQT